MTGAVTAPDLRPWPVGPQRQRGDAVELRPPVIELFFRRRRSRPALLPQCEVAVLESGRGPRCHALLACRGIMGGELLPEQPLRPAIGDEVMQIDHQRVAGFVERQQRDLQWRLVRQVERILRELERLAPDDRDLVVRRAGLELDPLEFWRRLQHKLRRLALPFDEDRTQRLMAGADRGEARRKRGDVDQAFEERDFDDIIVVAGRIEPREQVHPLLLVRQRRVRCRSSGPAPGRQRRFAMGCGGLQPGRKRGDRSAVEDVLEREVDVEAFAQARAHLRHRERVRAEREDVLIDADLRQLQQTGPDLRELRLQRGARQARRIGVLRRRDQISQCVALDLAAGALRQRRHAADQTRHLVGRETLSRELAQLVRGRLGIR
ncbi:hypothetical protein ACVJMY_003009 [Bradyrhizobium diazoefficiens]